MNLDNLPIGEDIPNDINVIIEIPAHGAPVKYEVEKDSGTLMVDRFMGTAMFYPCNYGFLPHTLSEDGDPVDILEMVDEAGEDHKVLAVPVSKLTKLYDDVQSPQDLHDDMLDQITHFFEQYKALESSKWVKVENWVGADRAREEILSSIDRYNRTVA